MSLIRLGTSSVRGNSSSNSSDPWVEKDHGENVQTMQLGNDEDALKEPSDLFEDALNRAHEDSNGKHTYSCLRLSRKILQSLNSIEIFIVEYPTKAVRNKYYKNMIPEIRIHYSPNCRKFFHEDDFEFECLKKGWCPFCRCIEEETAEKQNDI